MLEASFAVGSVCVCEHTLDCEVWRYDTYMHVYTFTCIYMCTCMHTLQFDAILDFSAIITYTAD